MIVVRIELWPGGSERQKRTLAVGTIANDGTGDQGIGHYDVRLAGDYHPYEVNWGAGIRRRTGRVEGHRRRQTSIWELIRKALNAAYDAPDRSGEDELRRALKLALAEHHPNGRREVWETVCACGWGGLNDEVASYLDHQVDALLHAVRVEKE